MHLQEHAKLSGMSASNGQVQPLLSLSLDLDGMAMSLRYGH